MTTARDITIYQGQEFTLSLDYAGATGRAQVMHIRLADSTATVVQILTHNGAANSRVIYNDATQKLDITIGATVSDAWVVLADRVEWVFDIKDYAPGSEDGAVIPYRGKVIVRGNRTRASDVTPSEQMPSGDGRYVRFDGMQDLTTEQQEQAQENLGITGGGGSGDVVGPASATDSRIAEFDGTTGKLIKQSSYTVASLLAAAWARASHTGTQLAATISDFATAAIAAVTWSTITGKPSTFDPSAHKTSHATGGGDALTASDIGAQSADATLTALAALDSSAGLLEQTGADTFTKRALGVGASTSVPTRADADARYAGASHDHTGVYQPLATVLTNTTASFTTAQETKLDAIEALADVTDAGNVGTAIDGATAKTTPVDADTVPLIDSAASNVLKKLSWANIKATLKTYFDGLYQAVLVSGTNIKTINSTSLLGSGDIAISGGASNLLVIDANEWIPRVTNGAGIHGSESTTNKVNIDQLAFDPATTEYADYWTWWPAGYTKLKISKIGWDATAGTAAQGVRWELAARCFADDDARDQAVGTVQGVTDALITIGDEHLSGASADITPAGTVAAGNRVLLRINRNPSHADDGLSGDALLGSSLIEWVV